MLRHLTVRNYTLIDALDLELDAGLTVITGETGAGKSIVLDALGLGLGNRADSRSIRAGAERLEVSASFDLSDTPEALAWLHERALELDGECQLRRVVTRDGRSRAWINGQLATLADIKALGDQLVDIHGQHEHHSLLARASQQRLLDEYGGHRALAERVAAAYADWRDCRDELQALRASAGERRDRQQLLHYQLGELAELAPGAKKSLPGRCFAGHEKSDLLWHGKKIAGAAQRRTKQGLLIQGSVQPPPLTLNREAWQRAMLDATPGDWSELSLEADVELAARTQELAAHKYARMEYNQRR